MPRVARCHRLHGRPCRCTRSPRGTNATTTDHIPPGFSKDHRGLNSGVGGGHSNIGDTYSPNAIGIRNFNLSTELITRLTDGHSLIEERSMPEDPAMYRVHRTEQHALFHTTHGYDKDSLRGHVNDLGPSAPCRRAERIPAGGGITPGRRTPGVLLRALPSDNREERNGAAGVTHRHVISCGSA